MIVKNKLLTYENLDKLSCQYGDSFYLIDEEKFAENYEVLLKSFKKNYSCTTIAYSYKTNYLPELCKIINYNGGCAEIVSEMEFYLAEKIGVTYKDIFYNGPWKKPECLEEMLKKGVNVNIDGFYEIETIKKIAEKYPQKHFGIGLRVAVDIGQTEPTRFGFELKNGDLKQAFIKISEIENVEVKGLHFHLPYRDIESFKKRTESLKQVLKMFEEVEFEYISMGGGYMGEIPKKMIDEFKFIPPSFDEYSSVIAKEFEIMMRQRKHKTRLIIEPGSALVANTMRLVTRVVNIKQSRSHWIATLSGSTFQMNPSVKSVQRAIEVIHNALEESKSYKNIDMAGYTCIEGDYLYRGYTGRLAKRDFVVFDNVGSYSIVMKPPFILPDVPIISINDFSKCMVREQTSEEVFKRFFR